MDISYTDLLDRDIRFYNNCIYGYLMKRENAMNDMTHVGHLLAGKISQAVWGSSDFNKPIKEIRLRPKSNKEKVLETLRNKGLIDD
jgi:hypothetical protein